MLVVLTMAISPEENSAALLDDCLKRIAEGDSHAFETLYEHTRVSVYSFAFSILKDPHDAEDVLHDCFMKIHAAASRYRSDGKPLAWILTITRNLCYGRLREQKRQSDLPQEEWESFLTSHEACTADDKLALTACLRELSDEERQVIVLHAVSGFKHREIAAITGLPLSTVLSKYHRAVKKLKALLE